MVILGDLRRAPERSRRPRRILRTLVAPFLVALVGLVGPGLQVPAHADYTSLCTGYSGCKDAGYSNFGYATANSTSYWNMYTGHNCTNYAAYRMVKAGLPNTRPWSGSGNAANWGIAMASITDQTPIVGSVAWWGAYVWPAGSAGHVAYVQKVVSDTEIVISEDSWGGDFHWRTVTKANKGWPSGFIHFKDVGLRSTAAPTLSATPQVGQTVTATTGSWTPAAASYTYQWLLDGAPISNATAATYTPGAGKVGHQLSVQVTATQAGYANGVATSAPVVIAPGDFTATTQPAVTGDPIVGATLTMSPGAWTPTPSSTSIQWLADGVPIAGATQPTLTLTGNEAGHQITAAVTAVRAGYNDSTLTSAPTAAVLQGVVTITTPPTISGEATYGQTLHVTTAFEPATSRVVYIWQRDGVRISGASGPDYQLTAEDVGAQVSVRIKVDADGYRGATATTDPTAAVRTVPRVRVRAIGGEQDALVKVIVDAPGIATVRGQITVKVGAQSRTVYLQDGRRKVLITGLSAGERPVTVTYLGRGLVDPGTFRGTVIVLP